MDAKTLCWSKRLWISWVSADFSAGRPLEGRNWGGAFEVEAWALNLHPQMSLEESWLTEFFWTAQALSLNTSILESRSVRVRVLGARPPPGSLDAMWVLGFPHAALNPDSWARLPAQLMQAAAFLEIFNEECCKGCGFQPHRSGDQHSLCPSCGFGPHSTPRPRSPLSFPSCF